MVEGDLGAQQQEVNRLMGRCVLRLQQYERQLKSILAHGDQRGTLQGLEGSVDTSQQTLGMLVRTFVGWSLSGESPHRQTTTMRIGQVPRPVFGCG